MRKATRNPVSMALKGGACGSTRGGDAISVGEVYDVVRGQMLAGSTGVIGGKCRS